MAFCEIFFKAASKIESPVKKVIQSGGDCIVSKLMHSHGTLHSGDLSGTTFNSLLNNLKHEGFNNVKIVPTIEGGRVVHVKDIERTGLAGLFPGGVITPNSGHLTGVSFKFNNAGDCLQMTAVQKTGNSVAGSTIRTTAGIDNLRKSGVKSPSEYIQVYSTKGKRYVNRTYSPFGDKPVQTAAVNPANDVEKEIKAVANSTVKAADDLLDIRYNKILSRIRSLNPQSVESIEAQFKNINKHSERGKALLLKKKQDVVDAYETLSDKDLATKLAQEQAEFMKKQQARIMEENLNQSINYIQRRLDKINPDLGDRVISKIYQIAEKDPVRAQKFADNLIERYSDRRLLERFSPKSEKNFLDDITPGKLDDIDDYYPKTKSDDLFEDPLSNPWDNPWDKPWENPLSNPLDNPWDNPFGF